MNAQLSLPITASATPTTRAGGARALRVMGAIWLTVALLGQGLFAVYVAVFYGAAAWQGRPDLWNRVLPKGFVAGETALNLVLAAHLAFAVIVIVGGIVQLIPRVRRVAPKLHRWNGRVYLLLSMAAALGGALLILGRGAAGDVWQHLGTLSNAAVIVVCAVMAWRFARARNYDSHRRWALRVFLAVSGVWFFRVGLMAWIVIHQGPVGFDPKTFTGPFLTFLAFAQYMVPLAVLELYFRALDRGGSGTRAAMSVGLGLATLLTLTGIGAASAFMWLPRL